LLSCARHFLLTHAFLPPRNPLLRFFKNLDRFWENLNYLTGGIVLIKDRNSLPGNRPVFWRETSKKSLGKPHYLFRVLVALEIPALFFMCLSGADSNSRWLIFSLWTIAALWIVAAAANVVASERTDQTLDVLLTTPMTGREIILQKMAAVRRLGFVLCGTIATVFLLEICLEMRRDIADHAEYIVSTVLSLIIYPPMLAWMALWIGMRSASRMKAVLIALTALILWCALPIVLLGVFQSQGMEYLAYLSPATSVISTELGDYPGLGRTPGQGAWNVIFWNYLFYVGILLYFRWQCLSGANRLLGRMCGVKGRLFWPQAARPATAEAQPPQ
jgi:hypothetical protein